MQQQAYDLDRFAPKEQKVPIRVIENNQLKQKREKSTKRIKMLSTIFSLLSLTVVLLYSQVLLTELTSEIKTAEKALVGVQSEYQYLSSKADMRMNTKTIHEKASAMGLLKADQSQVKYIYLEQDDKAIIKKSTWQEISDSVSMVFSSIFSK